MSQAEKEEEQTGPEALFSEYSSMLKAKVAGPPPIKALYYFLLLGATFMFMSSAVAILKTSQDTITTVNTNIAEEIEFPVIWACLSKFIPAESEVEINKKYDNESESNQMNHCKSDEAVIVDGLVENSLDRNYTNQLQEGQYQCADIITDDNDEPVLKKLKNHFNTEHCLVTNTGGQFVSEISYTRELYMKFTVQFIPELSTALVGFYKRGDSPFNGDVFIGAMNRVPIQNAISSIGISVDIVEDRRGMSYVDAAEISKKTEEYKVTTSWVPTEYYEDGDNIVVGDIDSGGTTHSLMIFYISDFIQHTITYSTKPFSSLWAELGGALTAATVIIAFAFRDEVVESKKNKGTSEKVKVFRYNKQGKEDAIEWAKEQAEDWVKEKATEVSYELATKDF